MTILGMSAKLGCPVGTIKRRLHMARKRLAVQVHKLAPELAPDRWVEMHKTDAEPLRARAI